MTSELQDLFSEILSIHQHKRYKVNHLTCMSEQDRISPYNTNTISSRQMMRIEKNINQGIIN